VCFSACARTQSIHAVRGKWWAEEYKLRRQFEDEAALSFPPLSGGGAGTVPGRVQDLQTNVPQADLSSHDGWEVHPPTIVAIENGASAKPFVADLQVSQRSSDDEAVSVGSVYLSTVILVSKLSKNASDNVSTRAFGRHTQPLDASAVGYNGGDTSQPLDLTEDFYMDIPEEEYEDIPLQVGRLGMGGVRAGRRLHFGIQALVSLCLNFFHLIPSRSSATTVTTCP
jgi:hypothetical protein